MDLIHPDEKARFARFAKDYTTAYILSKGSDMLRGTKRARESQDLSQASTATAASQLQLIHSRHEMIDRKRLPPSSYRLHPAKYLQMDKMLKSMFFPTMTTKLNFGISSFSGVNLVNAHDKTDGLPAPLEDRLRTRGLFRGLAMFDVRNTDGGITRSTADGLNCTSVRVGETAVAAGNAMNIGSMYRRYHSQPLQVIASGGSSSADGDTVVNQEPDIVNTDSETAGTIRSLTLGTNLSDIEENATAGMCYSDPVIAQYRLRGQAGTASASSEAANTNMIDGEPGPVLNSANTTWTGPDQNNYFTHMQDAVVRVTDGYVHLDIMNTEQTPCVVEVVIHSKKKNDRTKAQIFNELFTDVNRHLKAKGVVDNSQVGANPSGGWQAFWDPNYPLLKVPSKARCLQYISEVHRSNHVLAPGQAKTVKIALGNLWYKLGNKSDRINDDYNPALSQQFPKVKDNTGCLYFSIGHSGFEYPQSVTNFGPNVTNVETTPGDLNTPLTGAGFWVGKTNAPSSISIDGVYQDKFYPITIDRSPNNVLDHNAPRPAVLSSSKGLALGAAAVPLATIIPQRVATSSGVVDEV